MYRREYFTSEINKPYLQKLAAPLGKQRVRDLYLFGVSKKSAVERFIFTPFLNILDRLQKQCTTASWSIFTAFLFSYLQWDLSVSLCAYSILISFTLHFLECTHPALLSSREKKSHYIATATASPWLSDEAKSGARLGCSACTTFKVKSWLLSGRALWDRQYWQCITAIQRTQHVLHTD